MTYVTDTEQIQAAAFRSIALFVHETYDGMLTKDISGEEGYILGIVNATESLVAAMKKESEE